MFEEIFGTLQTECGYTPNEINEMTLLDVQRLSNHWRRSPPVTVLLRYALAAMGVALPDANKTTNKNKYLTAEEFGALVRATDGLRMK